MTVDISASEKAVSLFDRGFSCSQSVFAAFAPRLGLDEALALRLAQPFAGGMVGSGDWCGAVTGAMMVLGALYGRDRADDDAAKKKTYAEVERFFQAFTAAHGSKKCRELLGCDISTPEGKKIQEERKLHETVCRGLVRDAAALLEKQLAG